MFSLLYSLDVELYHLINLSYHNFILNNLALGITFLGVLYTAVIVMLLVLILDRKRGRNVCLILLATVILTFVITGIFKYVILRPRPYEVLSNVILLSTGTDPSFPSGHTANATAIFYVLAKEYPNLKYLMILPILVGISRIYIGVHYPSDVLGGFILGMLIAYIVEYIFHNKLKVK